MKKNRKIQFILLSLVIIIVTIVLVYTFRKPSTSVGRTKAELSISADKLFANFEDNEEIANQKYVGKVIEVKGIVLKAEKNNDYSVSIKLETGSMFGTVICNFSPNEINIDNDITINSKLSIKGSCSGFLMDVILEKCTIVDS